MCTHAGPPFVKFEETPENTATYMHTPDPTAVDPDGDPQTLYATHWGGVKPFAHNTGGLPDPLASLPAPQDAPDVYLRDFKEVKDIGMCFVDLWKCWPLQKKQVTALESDTRFCCCTEDREVFRVMSSFYENQHATAALQLF